jgi:hypothetical protein
MLISDTMPKQHLITAVCSKQSVGNPANPIWEVKYTYSGIKKPIKQEKRYVCGICCMRFM